MDTGQGWSSLKNLSPASFTVVLFYVFWIFLWFAFFLRPLDCCFCAHFGHFSCLLSFYVHLITAFALILDILQVFPYLHPHENCFDNYFGYFSHFSLFTPRNLQFFLMIDLSLQSFPVNMTIFQCHITVGTVFFRNRS